MPCIKLRRLQCHDITSVHDIVDSPTGIDILSARHSAAAAAHNVMTLYVHVVPLNLRLYRH